MVVHRWLFSHCEGPPLVNMVYGFVDLAESTREIGWIEIAGVLQDATVIDTSLDLGHHMANIRVIADVKVLCLIRLELTSKQCVCGCVGVRLLLL